MNEAVAYLILAGLGVLAGLASVALSIGRLPGGSGEDASGEREHRQERGAY